MIGKYRLSDELVFITQALRRQQRRKGSTSPKNSNPLIIKNQVPLANPSSPRAPSSKCELKSLQIYDGLDDDQSIQRLTDRSQLAKRRSSMEPQQWSRSIGKTGYFPMKPLIRKKLKTEKQLRPQTNQLRRRSIVQKLSCTIATSRISRLCVNRSAQTPAQSPPNSRYTPRVTNSAMEEPNYKPEPAPDRLMQHVPENLAWKGIKSPTNRGVFDFEKVVTYINKFERR